ncbi:caspase family protein [Myxococcota bacterium]|nr:caspase family protein [Myxococcota bacterium]MBU1430593.1 caspase family protein [Myxococcota bacterium]MBU1899059.1 caspase family protein [Myxococcota bacterium]
MGANSGEPDEETLRYAEQDAVRVADVLTGFSEVPAENLVLLRGPTEATARRALEQLGARIEQARTAEPGAQSMLFVYYSGHAGARGLHLGGTQLQFAQLIQLIQATHATVAILVVDACQSGRLTRVKGARKATPFEIKPDEHLNSAGLAIVTSSAAGEDAQESDQLKGGIFTHHLVTGLLGGADRSGDQRVTLTEVYQYAYHQTILTTSRTAFAQHPTYAFRVSGQQEIVLTRLAEARSMGRLGLADEGAWLIIDEAPSGAVVAELTVPQRAEVLVPPGDYVVRRRSDRAVFEGRVSVKRGAQVVVRGDDLSRVAYGRTVRKGLAGLERRSAWSLSAGGEMSSAILPDAALGHFGALGVQVDLEAIALQLRLRYGRSGAQNALVEATYDLMGADLGAYKVFDLPKLPLGLGLGVRLGGDRIQQRFASDGIAPDRVQWIGRVGPVLRAELALGARATLSVDGGADITLIDLRGEGEASAFTPQVVGFGGLSLGVYLP